MRAWIFQDSRQKKSLGEDKCPWSVGWYEPGCKKKKSKRLGPGLKPTSYGEKSKASWQVYTRFRFELTGIPS